MKPYSDVNQARAAKSEGRGESVFRSSLLAPRMPAAATQIAFLNHFLLKRGIDAVSCKITGITLNGSSAGSYSFQIDSPIVYAIWLEEIFPQRSDISQFLIEFYSQKDLAVPYPAVMINHWGEDFMNCVHAFNRILNDVFEDDAVNKVAVAEASIDVVCSKPYSTFFNATSGPVAPGGTLELSCVDDGVHLKKFVELSQVRLSSNIGFIADIFPQASLSPRTTLKVRQPTQSLFYGRMLAGVRNQETGAFSANHSYYDNSCVLEYFENDTSRRCYPYFKQVSNGVIVYPIMSPGDYDLRVHLLDGSRTYVSDSYRVSSPDGQPAILSVDQIVADAGLSDCTAFQIEAKASNRGRIPTRVMHQLVYGDIKGRSRLQSSIAVGLLNAAVFIPENRPGICWGQLTCHPDYQSWLGLCFGTMDGQSADVAMEIYSTDGLVRQWTERLEPGRALIIANDGLGLPHQASGVVWFMARSPRADLSAQSIHIHRKTGNASGEHSF